MKYAVMVDDEPLCTWVKKHPELGDDIAKTIIFPLGFALGCGMWEGEDLALSVAGLVSRTIGAEYTVTLKAGATCPAESEE